MPLPEPYYDDGQIQIFHGDCRDILPHLAPGSVDLVLTDPPYQSLDVEVKKGGTTVRLARQDELGGKRLASLEGRAWFDTLGADDILGIIADAQSLLADDGALYVFADVKSGLELFPPLRPVNVIVWDKQKLGMGYNWRRMHEWIAFVPQPKHELRDKGRGDIIRCSGVSEKVHPTQKPEGVLKTIILNSTDTGDLVIDPFMGSGATLAAAQQLGRRAVGIETVSSHCAAAVRRLQQAVLPLDIPA